MDLDIVRKRLIKAKICSSDGKPLFKTSLNKLRRSTLLELKKVLNITERSATISVYLLWNGLQNLPLCSCGSGKSVVWPALTSCGISCAMRQQQLPDKNWKREASELDLSTEELLDKYELFGKKNFLSKEQRSVLFALAQEKGIDYHRYEPRQLILLLRTGMKSFPLCTCGSGIEVIPTHIADPDRFCSSHCSAANSARQAATEKTNLELYGVKNIWACPNFVSSSRPKRRKTMEAIGKWVPQTELTEYEIYRRAVTQLTDKNVHLIPNYDSTKRGRAQANEDTWQVDHRFSIVAGFKEKILPVYIAHPVNLQFVPWLENLVKHYRCDFTSKELFRLIEEYEKSN